MTNLGILSVKRCRKRFCMVRLHPSASRRTYNTLNTSPGILCH